MEEETFAFQIGNSKCPKLLPYLMWTGMEVDLYEFLEGTAFLENAEITTCYFLFTSQVALVALLNEDNKVNKGF